MVSRLVALSLSVAIAACDSSAAGTLPDGTSPHPLPSQVGTLTIRLDTGVLVVGRRLRVTISAADASGAPIDASNTEVTASNPAVAQFVGAIAIPIASQSPLSTLVAAFDLTAAGSTAIRARLGILADSIVISVVPPT